VLVLTTAHDTGGHAGVRARRRQPPGFRPRGTWRAGIRRALRDGCWPGPWRRGPWRRGPALALLLAGALRRRSASVLVALPAAVWLNLFGGVLSDKDCGLTSTEKQEMAQLRRENRRLHEGVPK
jgi:hypothetical protein